MHSESQPRPKKGSLVKFTLFWLLLAGVAGFLAFRGLESREAQNQELVKRTAAQAVRTVNIIQPAPPANNDTLELPGRLDAYQRAPLFARVSGYIKKWTVDIGAAVKSGQVLAEIEAPDLDQQLLQAESQLKDAEAASELADVTAKRYEALLPSSFVSRQNADEKITDAASKRAQVKSVKANLERLRALTDFKRIVAPFGGVVTARNTDIGSLINSGSSTGAPLFVVADTHKLRLYVNVPQAYVPSVPIGSGADLTVPEYPNKTFTATVEATSQSVDAASGSTQMLLMVSNEAGELLSGSYVTVRFKLAHKLDALQIPASALIFDSGGLRVATVDGNGRIQTKKVKIGRDFGRVVEIASGLLPNDRVIDSPPDGLADGEAVRIANEDANPPPPAPAPGKSAS
jgi:RND family efflux transporter MFP subunit